MARRRKNMDRVFAEVARLVEPYGLPMVDAMTVDRRCPFRVLIATLLSLRTKDEVTEEAARRLFDRADTPETVLGLEEGEIAEAIYPVGFYRTKARTLRNVCRDLLERFDGRVPSSMEALLSLKGVGRKTANLVLAAGYGKPAICVDTHVHRITNRWGYVETSAPDETEAVLRRRLPKRYWMVINRVLVTLGQNICKPISPLCSRCSLETWWCQRVGVGRSR